MFTSLCSTKCLYACLNPSVKHWSISLMISTCSVPLALMVFKTTLGIRCKLKDVLKCIGLPRDSGAWELGGTHLPASQSASVSSNGSESWLLAWKGRWSIPCSKRICGVGWVSTLLLRPVFGIWEAGGSPYLCLKRKWRQRLCWDALGIIPKIVAWKALLFLQTSPAQMQAEKYFRVSKHILSRGVILCLEAVRKHTSHR